MKKGSPEGYNAETGLAQPAQKLTPENPLNVNHYIGFDVHKNLKPSDSLAPRFRAFLGKRRQARPRWRPRER